MNRDRLLRIAICVVALLFSLGSNNIASANKLTFFYDPGTGNVSFDTAETISGEVLAYALYLYPEYTPITFRYENHISLTGSPLMFSDADDAQEAMFTPISGFLTIGDILPPGLSEGTWLTLFTQPTGSAGYSPGFGFPGSHAKEFEYGLPDREFDNRWDIVDPDTLDWATEASLVYREDSGEVLVDTRGTNGGHFSGFSLHTDDLFEHGNFTPPWESLIQTITSDRLIMFGNALEPGLYSLGSVLDAGLTETEYQNFFTEAKFYGQAGFSGDLDLETEGQVFSMVYVAIPEPTSMVFMVLAGAMILSSRKKHQI